MFELRLAHLQVTRGRGRPPHSLHSLHSLYSLHSLHSLSGHCSLHVPAPARRTDPNPKETLSPHLLAGLAQDLLHGEALARLGAHQEHLQEGFGFGFGLGLGLVGMNQEHPRRRGALSR